MEPSEGFCWTCWLPPAGPDTPFKDTLVVWDSFRILALVMCLTLIVMCAVSMYRSRNRPQRTRFLTILLLTGLAASIQVEHLGDTANWRLLATLAALSLGNTSVLQYLRNKDRWHMIAIPSPTEETDNGR